jgi:hypothetical protein
MRIARPRSAKKFAEQGYALIMVVFLATALLVATMLIAPSILTEGRRQQEMEMIWRGKQYARGVKLYYRKLGRFPTSLDDLTKPKVGSLRFMRQAYKDPMNDKDGTWRFIYVGAAGQLIGSLKPPQNLQLPQAGAIGTPVSSLAGPGAPAQPGTSGTQSPAGSQPGGTQPGGTASGSGSNPPGATSADTGTGSNDPMLNPQQGSTDDTPTIIGGNIIGVGSKVNKRSIMVYDKAKNYRLFEFIWDPSKDSIGVGQPGMQTGTGFGHQPGQGPGNPPGQTPFGQQPGQGPGNPPQNPPQPPQNPQQQQ